MSQKIKIRHKFDAGFLLTRDTFYNSIWVNKFINKFVKQGRKHIIERHFKRAFSVLKYSLKRLPGFLLLQKIFEFRPLLTYINKTINRKQISIPLPIKERRQCILALDAIVKHIKNLNDPVLSTRIVIILSDIFANKKHLLVKKLTTDVKILSEARLFVNLRW